MEDCYKILGVAKNASIAEIKKAFRKKAKELHPDTATSNDKTTTEQFRSLLRAYDILSDIHSRTIFDNSFFYKYHIKKNKSQTFDYRIWLLQRGDEESFAKLIFWDLLHHREDDAVEEFKSLTKNHIEFTFHKWFSREDFMDCGYILAEELAIRGEFYDAFLLLEQIIKMEYDHSYFKLFFPEVISFTLHILKHKITENVNDELSLDVFERALDLGFSKEDKSFFLKKMAAIYTKMGDKRIADICLLESKNLS